MNQEELQAIKARCEAATPGPWTKIMPLGDIPYVQDVDFRDLAEVAFERDATFIAHAREDVPALLAEVERLHTDFDRVTRGTWSKELARLSRLGWEFRTKAEELQVEVERLKAALEQVEWIDVGITETTLICPWCRGLKTMGHDPDCPRQVALGLDK